MIILTARLPKKKLALGVVLASALCCCLLAFGLGEQPFALTMAGGQSTAVKSEKDRQSYLAQWGWQVAGNPTVEELVIPSSLDESYDDYLALQEAQGFPSLSQFPGERVRRYCYQVTNYPGAQDQEEIWLHLLVHDQEVVAGEVFALSPEGFLHGLSRAQSQ